MAMEKIKEANIQKLFIKVFTMDGSAKSLLVDEKMLCSYVTRLLADKNHVQMDPKWAVVEHLPDLYMGECKFVLMSLLSPDRLQSRTVVCCLFKALEKQVQKVRELSLLK